jgi:hypothetical protein
VSVSEAFRAASTDLSDAEAAARTIVVGLAWLISPAATGTGTVHILTNSVYTKVIASAMLIAETLGYTNRNARAPSADGVSGAIGVLSAFGRLTRAVETAGSLRTVGVLLTGCHQAVRISAGVVDRTLSGLRAVPAALTVEARHPFGARKVADLRPYAMAVDTSFALGTL